MNIFDFVTLKELEGLPENPQMAFISIVQLADKRLAARLNELGRPDEDTYDAINDAQFGFQSFVTAAAVEHNIKALAALGRPDRDHFNFNNYRDFRDALSFYTNQIVLARARYDRSESVPLLDRARQSIKTYITHLRGAIGSAELSNSKKARLNSLLDELEKELERKRVRLVVVANVTLAIMAAPGTMIASYDAVVRVTNLIMREFGEAKAADDEQYKISSEDAVVLLPPTEISMSEADFPQSSEDESPF